MAGNKWEHPHRPDSATLRTALMRINKMLRHLSAALLAALLVAPLPAAAQVATQQSGTRLDASTLACSSSPAFEVTQHSTTTCTPQAGQFVYISAIAFDVCTDGTGTATTPTTFTS